MNHNISTDKAHAAIGPYSQAVAVPGLVFVSGQLPIDPATGSFASEGIAGQTRQSLTNIAEILKEAGSSMENVVKTTVLLQSMDDFAAMNAVYAEFFKDGVLPARAAFEVAKLPKGALVEIECVASL